MALAVGAAARLHEAVVEGEVVADAVAPAGTAAPEVRIVVQYPLIDVAEYELALLGAEDRHGDDADVTVVRFRFVVGSDGLLVRSSRGEQIAVSYIDIATTTILVYNLITRKLWLGGRVVRIPDLRSTGRGFEARPSRCRVQPWASCLHTCTSVTKQYNLHQLGGWLRSSGHYALRVSKEQDFTYRMNNFLYMSSTKQSPYARLWFCNTHNAS